MVYRVVNFDKMQFLSEDLYFPQVFYGNELYVYVQAWRDHVVGMILRPVAEFGQNSLQNEPLWGSQAGEFASPEFWKLELKKLIILRKTCLKFNEHDLIKKIMSATKSHNR